MTQYNENISYEIKNNGYNIYLDGKLWITQPEPYTNLYVPEGTYEENCLAQLAELTREPEPVETEFDKGFSEGYEQALLDLMELELEAEEE